MKLKVGDVVTVRPDLKPFCWFKEKEVERWSGPPQTEFAGKEVTISRAYRVGGVSIYRIKELENRQDDSSMIWDWLSCMFEGCSPNLFDPTPTCDLDLKRRWKAQSEDTRRVDDSEL